MARQAVLLGTLPVYLDQAASAAACLPGGYVNETSGAVVVLAAAALAGAAPALDTVALAQTHVLAGSGLAVAAPTLAAPTLIQAQVLAPGWLADAAPAPGAQELNQSTALAGAALAVDAPALDGPALAQMLLAIGLACPAPGAGTAALAQSHLLAPALLSVAGPACGAPGAVPGSVLTIGTGPQAVLGAVYLDAAGSQQGIVGGAYVNETGSLGIALVAAAPLFDAPALVAGAGNTTLLPVGLADAAPTLDARFLNRAVLAGGALATAAPILGAPAVNLGVTGSLRLAPPILGAAVLAQLNKLTTVVPSGRQARLGGIPGVYLNAAGTRQGILAGVFSDETSPAISGLYDSAPLFGAPREGVACAAAALAAAAPLLDAGVLSHPLPNAATLVVAAPTLGTAPPVQTNFLPGAELDDGAALLEAVPAFGVYYDLAAPDFVDSAALPAAPALLVTLSAGAVQTAAPAEGVPAFSQLCVLAAPALTAPAPTFSAALMLLSGQMGTGPIIIGPPLFGAPAFKQSNALTAAGLAADAPVAGSPAAVLGNVLLAAGLATTASPAGGTALAQCHALPGADLDDGAPVLDAAPTLEDVLSVTYYLVIDADADQGDPDDDAIVTFIDGFTTDVPVFADASVLQFYTFTAPALMLAAPVLDAPLLGVPQFGQHQYLTAAPVLDAPALLNPALFAQAQLLAATSPGPALAVLPAATIVVPESTDPLTVAAPAIDQPVLAQRQHLVAIASGAAPVIGAPAPGQHCVFVAALPAVPPLFSPALMLLSGQMGTEPMLVGAPVTDQPVLSQVHALTAVPVQAAAPVLAVPLFAASVVMGAGLAVGAPVLVAAPLAQLQALIAISPMLVPLLPDAPFTLVDVLDTLDLDDAAPFLDTPTFNGTHWMWSGGFTVSTPRITEPDFLTQRQYSQGVTARIVGQRSSSAVKVTSELQ